MSDRDYARIMWWKKKTLGLMLVNRHQQNFFLHAETLTEMVNQPETLKMIKRREIDPNNSGPLHPGDILGKVKIEGATVSIVLAFGEVERRMRIDNETRRVSNVLERQAYTFPAEEFNILLQSLKLMILQNEPFNTLWRGSQAQVPAYYFVDMER